MGTSNIEISILKKRLELLEMKIGELNSINPEILNERLAKIEERLYVVKEMLTTEEASKYLVIMNSVDSFTNRQEKRIYMIIHVKKHILITLNIIAKFITRKLSKRN